ncbi:MAG TPA: helix-turn-helix transcriptional regulator [Cyclobacteriaceae bacterium]|nr:helix-turn-helix transcriptional regulator [Cyclobacteriaceae bacterium]
MKIPVAFGLMIKEARAGAGLSQRQLAAKCKLNSTYISLLERGERQPTVTSLIKICQAVGVKPSEMFREYEKQYW